MAILLSVLLQNPKGKKRNTKSDSTEASNQKRQRTPTSDIQVCGSFAFGLE